jgi:hypothetical protein
MRHRLVIGLSRDLSIVVAIPPHQWRTKMNRPKRLAAGFSLALLVGLAAAACTQPGASPSPSAMMESPSAMMESPSAMMESPSAMMESPSPTGQ